MGREEEVQGGSSSGVPGGRPNILYIEFRVYFSISIEDLPVPLVVAKPISTSIGIESITLVENH